jgi:phosphoglycerol transferase MdoB-like AlkP superfamily enzyme
VETTTPAVPPPPPPPPPSAADAPVVRRFPRPGQLTPWWRLATVATWALVLVAWSGVWKASRELGVAVWWLGPDGDPQPIFIMLLPFVVPLAMIVLALNNVRHLPWYGLAGAALMSVFGFIDLAYVRRFGLVELLIAAAAAAVAVAGFGGTYVRVGGTDEVAAALNATPVPNADADGEPIAGSPG